jgi:hypothetical protein
MIEPLSGRHVRTETAVGTRDVVGKRLFQNLKATFPVRKIQPSSILNPTIPVQPILAPKSGDRRLAWPFHKFINLPSCSPKLNTSKLMTQRLLSANGGSRQHSIFFFYSDLHGMLVKDALMN